jgi:SMI1 / KNR4 family (SUKH-1)
MNFLTKDLKKKGPANNKMLDQILAELDFTPPEDYLRFIEKSNGAEGFINESYLQLLSIEELKEFNIMHKTDKYAPGYFIVGSNLGGIAYAFDKKESKIVAFEHVSMLISDKPEILGNNFLGFLVRLSESTP